jgi:hypothetical protein
VCGGGALIPGLRQRLLHDLRECCPSDPAPNLCHIPEYMPVRFVVYQNVAEHAVCKWHDAPAGMGKLPGNVIPPPIMRRRSTRCTMQPGLEAWS